MLPVTVGISFILVVILILFGNNIENFLTPYPRLTTVFSMVLTITIAYIGIFRERNEKVYHSKFIKKNIDFKMSKYYGSNYKHIEQLNMHLSDIKKLVDKKNKELISHKEGNIFKNIFVEEYVNSVAIFMKYYILYDIEDSLSKMGKDLEDEMNDVKNLYLKESSKEFYIDIISSIRNINKMFSNNLFNYKFVDNFYRELLNQDSMVGLNNRILLNKVFNNIDDLADDFNKIFEYYKELKETLILRKH
ncbi:hypothetical protein [Staphylococcus shinii]|uniref:hypothetical protein n=1 Tax=Staphylococcus shinii TaxID=2912228 RepID=UPI003F877AB1